MAGRPAKVWTGTEWVPLAVAQAVDTDGITAASAAAIYLRQDTASATYLPISASSTLGGGAVVEMSTSEPPDPEDGTLWVDTDSDIDTLNVEDYVSKDFVDAKGDIIVGSSASSVANLTVGSDGQMLMADSSATAGLRYVDPPTNRNLLINGAMQVAQRGTSATGVTSSTTCLTADRWSLNTSGTLGTWTQSVENDGPTGSGFTRSLKMLWTTANASLDTGDFLSIEQRIEGQDLQSVKKGTTSAQPLTLSFWVKSNVVGTYICNLTDLDNVRQVSASYSISVSDTWEQKSVIFPADTTGAFDNDNGASIYARFGLAMGSTYTSGTLATSWESTVQANRFVGQTDVSAAIDNYWQVTGVQLETGPVATPFEFEPYETTLRKCQRYYQRITTTSATQPYAMGQADSATATFGVIHFETTMRTAPTALETTGTSSDYRIRHNGGNITCDAVPSFQAATANTMRLSFSGTGMTTGQAVGLWANAAGYLAWSAEL